MCHVFEFCLALETSDQKIFKHHINKKARVEFHTGLFRIKNLLGSYYFAAGAGAAGAGAAGACIIGAGPYP